MTAYLHAAALHTPPPEERSPISRLIGSCIYPRARLRLWQKRNVYDLRRESNHNSLIIHPLSYHYTDGAFVAYSYNNHCHYHQQQQQRV
jgi:hypothetical protein